MLAREGKGSHLVKVLVTDTVGMMKHHDKEQPEEEKVYVAYTSLLLFIIKDQDNN